MFGTERQRGRETERQRDRETERQRDRETDNNNKMKTLSKLLFPLNEASFRKQDLLKLLNLT